MCASRGVGLRAYGPGRGVPRIWADRRGGRVHDSIPGALGHGRRRSKPTSPRGPRDRKSNLIKELWALPRSSGLPRLCLRQSLAVTRGLEWACPGTPAWGRPPGGRPSVPTASSTPTWPPPSRGRDLCRGDPRGPREQLGGLMERPPAGRPSFERCHPERSEGSRGVAASPVAMPLQRDPSSRLRRSSG